MHELTLARGIATVTCGLWLLAVSLSQANAEDKVIKLAGGHLRIVNSSNPDADDKNAKVQIEGQEFDLGYGAAIHHKTFRLPNREIVILATFGDVRGMPPRYDILSVGRRGTVQHIKNPAFSTADDTFIATQKGDVIDFILGYEDGLKKSAVLSAEGLTVSTTKEARLAIPKRDCQWLYKQALSECIKDSCYEIEHSMSVERGFFNFENNPKWAVARDRFTRSCHKACQVKKRPAYADLAREVCGIQ